MRLRNSARASVMTPQKSSVIASARIRVSSNASPWARSMAPSTYTPPMAAGTEPTPIHTDSGMSTVFWRRCLMPPTVLVTAP